MCGRNIRPYDGRYNHCHGDPNIALIVSWCKKAHAKHQAKKQQKLALANQNVIDDRARTFDSEKLQYNANAEILDKAGMPPPSYQSVVVNRALAPDSNIDVKKSFDSSETNEAGYDVDAPVANGLRAPQMEMSTQAPVMGMEQTRRGCCGQKKAARRAAKAAAMEMRTA